MTCVDERPVLALTEAPGKQQRLAYRRFVEAGLAETDEELAELLKTSRWGIGDPEFQDRIRDRHTELTNQARRQEDVSYRRVSPAASAETVLHAVAKGFGVDEAVLRKRQYGCVERAAAALMLCRHAGLNQRDAATYLGMGSGSAVCQQLKALRERLASEPELAACVTRIVSAIESEKEPAVDATI